MTASPEAPRHAAAASTAASTAASAANEPSIGELVQQASESLSTIVRGEIELAKLELRSSLKYGGVGLGMFAAAAVLLVFSLTFGLIALAEGLIAIGLYRWLGYLAVFGLLLLIIGALAYLGFKKVKRVKAPQRTIDTGKDTVAYLKSHPKSHPKSSQ
ncbi:MAG: phage holin family protein [Jatrophihabitantaceae bacterium]